MENIHMFYRLKHGNLWLFFVISDSTVLEFWFKEAKRSGRSFSWVFLAETRVTFKLK